MPERAKLTLSQRMARIRKVDTGPELIVRRLAHALGYRFRLHRRDLPGTPDLVFPACRKVILVHGCFWHRHDCPAGRKLPRGKSDYWRPKLERNATRDAVSTARLRELGWDVLTLRECQLADLEQVRRQIVSFLGPRPSETAQTRRRR